MPQHPRKVTLIVPAVGVKSPVFAGNYYTVSAGVATLVGRLQYINKGVSGNWPAKGWSPLAAPGIEQTKEAPKERHHQHHEHHRETQQQHF